MTYYLGKPGGLTALPDPEAGLPQSPERIGGTHQLLSGARVRDTIGRMRTWNMTWTAIDLTTFGLLQSFFHAAGGGGPYYLLDPEQRNLLPLNVSSGTGATGDLTGYTLADAHFTIFVAAGGSNLTGVGGPFPVWSSDTLGISVLSTAVTNNQIVTTNRVPVLGSTTYTGSGYISNHTTTTGVAARINWLDSAGAWTLGQTTGSTVAAGATGRSVATGAAPAGAYYARMDLFITSSNTSGSTQFVDADGFQLEQASAVSAWAPGVDVPLVTVESLTRSTPLAGICDAQMTLVQVG